MTTCKNCNEPIAGNYCAHCGQPVKLKRIDAHYIVHEIEHILHFERGILYTVKELLIRPGHNIRHFISDNRNRLVKPIIFILVTSLIYTLLIQVFHIEQDGYIFYQEERETTTGIIFKWIKAHYGYSNIMMGVFIALWLKVFFRKYDYNFFEILILLCFVIGMMMLIFSVFIVILGVTNLNVMDAGASIAVLYAAWAIGQFFDKNKAASYLKTIASYFLGLLLFSLSIMLVGNLIDFLTK